MSKRLARAQDEMRKLVNSIGEWQVPRESVVSEQCHSAVPLDWRIVRCGVLLGLVPNIIWFFDRRLWTMCDTYIFSHPPWLSPHLTERGSGNEFVGLGSIRKNQACSPMGNDGAIWNLSRLSVRKCSILLLVLQGSPASYPGLCGAVSFPPKSTGN